MSKPAASDFATLGLDDLRDLVAALLERVASLEAENAALREEIARLKGLKGRPKMRPSGMAAKAGTSTGTGKRQPREQAGWFVRTSRRVPVVTRSRSSGLRHRPARGSKRYEDFVVQDLRLASRVIRYRQELGDAGRADGDSATCLRACAGISGLNWCASSFCSTSRAVTTERLTAMLNGDRHRHFQAPDPPHHQQ
ncbi:MAG: hypothetical protein R3C97_18630 [Geminicoccaceae bacterium]